MMVASKRERFPLPRASGCCRFGQRTFAGASGNDGCAVSGHAKQRVPQAAPDPNRPFGSAIPAALSIEYVIKNKGEVTPTVVGRLSDVEQTYGVGSIRYCFAPIAVIGRVQSPRLLSTQTV